MKTTMTFLLALLALATAASGAEISYSQLTPEQQVAQFRCQAVYTNADGNRIGAQFTDVRSGFVLDLVTIQSLPQAFVWVNSLPPSDQGEPHTCEHLLLGKGTVGRYVASLEDMSLTSSSAFTMQLQTCYHSHTDASADQFFKVFREQLNALINPNFSDEEIRREVCNMGIKIDQTDSSLQLEEKGTVYNEMLSSFESPWGPMYFEIDRLVYGPNHPMSYSSGGYPDAIRTMTPDDLRRFHRNAYRINNMGAILSLPPDISIETALSEMSRILSEVDPTATLKDDPLTLNDRLPAPKPAPSGTVSVVPYPSQKESEPGYMVMAWNAAHEASTDEQFLMELLMAGFASDQSSLLYKALIDSRTKQVDCGVTSLEAWVSADQGHPIYLALDNVNRDFLTSTGIDSLRTFVRDQLKALAGCNPGSPELEKFNADVRSRMEERKRNLRVFLDSPPRFGFRGTGSEWMGRVFRAARHSGFERSLVFDSEFRFVDSVLNVKGNCWSQFISKWRLLDDSPLVSAAVADPTLLATQETARKARVDAYVKTLESKYGVSNEAEAIARFKADYDKETAVIDQEAKSIPMPPFTDTPPLTLDDHLKYSPGTLPGGGQFVGSTFDNMSGATIGLAFGLNALPESLLLCIPALPSLMSEVGFFQDGRAIGSAEAQELRRKEILRLSVGYSVNFRTQRAELVVRGSGSDSTETAKATDWLNRVLFSSDLRIENIGRIRDVIDQSYAGVRNRMRGSVEGWVDSPVNAYWRQDNPTLLYADCFLTQAHALLRLKWMLREGTNATETSEFTGFVNEVGTVASDLKRAELQTLLDTLVSTLTTDRSNGTTDPLTMRAMALGSGTKSALKEAVDDLRNSLAEIPDATLATDFRYLCSQIGEGYALPARVALERVRVAIATLLHQDNVRGFMVGSSRIQGMFRPVIDQIVAKCSSARSKSRIHTNSPLVFEHLRERVPGLERPEYAGLVFEDTRAGIFYNTANCASFVDSTDDVLYNFLAARLYGGGGAHSMFMKTWGAGLAYSNGLRSNEANGRVVYYAERCPDLSQTMQFVVNELKNAPNDPSLAEYALAQAFAMSRSGASYESRGEAMAADLADGLTPEIVAKFRRKMLSLRQGDHFAQQVQARMETVYGLLLPGYGPGPEESIQKADARYFIVGPESQFESYERYLKSTEGPNTSLYRLYPRDFWITK